MLRHLAPARRKTSQQLKQRSLSRKGTLLASSTNLKAIGVCLLLLIACALSMRSFALFSTNPSKQSRAQLAATSNDAVLDMRERVESALWSFFAGDALSAPSHWFYGGPQQVQQYYGKRGILGYTKPSYELQGSILNKSNLAGGGRSGSSAGSNVIGPVINHGKESLWAPRKSIHYHATLESGEPTLEAQIARVLMRSIAANSGQFDADHFRKAYIEFMTTPGSHNDTYASTCHRMFFANYHYKKLDPKDCPDNDKHNVDTIDGLVLPTITALAVAAGGGTREEAARQAAATASVTRRSSVLESYASAWGTAIYSVARGDADASAAAQTMARQLRLTKPQPREKMTACYLDSATPAMLDMIVASRDRDVFASLLVNANIGGENVHRGSCLGAILGLSSSLRVEHREGLYPHDKIGSDIKEFLDAVFQTEI